MQNIKKDIRYFILITAGVLLISLIVFKQYIFDGYYFLSKGMLSDLLRANLPTYYHIFDSLSDGGYFWSW